MGGWKSDSRIDTQLTIFCLFRSATRSVMREMVWLPRSFTSWHVVVKRESPLMADSFRFCQVKKKWSRVQWEKQWTMSLTSKIKSNFPLHLLDLRTANWNKGKNQMIQKTWTTLMEGVHNKKEYFQNKKSVFPILINCRHYYKERSLKRRCLTWKDTSGLLHTKQGSLSR